MNIHFRKRKKLVFNNHKAVRTAINLNTINGQLVMYDRPESKEESSWERDWIEQILEMKPDSNSFSQTASRQNKLIIKWWEN